ncbi:DUF6635 family protein, partial [Klebsiella pneumoniae]|uniref:DUF6635 family protein n=1 Tax=Klebsiella pneumoniae TaxID=573 RepID=UPI003464A7ED
RIPGFVDATFSLAGSIRLHRAALGWDLLRAPANLTLAAPQLALQAAGFLATKAGARATGQKLGRTSLLLRTAVARELEWRLQTDLLELP